MQHVRLLQRFIKNKVLEDGFEVILIGHEGHPEVEGTMGRISGPVYLVSNTDDVKKLNVNNPDKLSYIGRQLYL